ncbi:MAG TPA: hypothetical protein VFI25_05510 [Planctomycetota bacterium]|nr:hypothetical protein [Planctomycetota bacterium]
MKRPPVPSVPPARRTGAVLRPALLLVLAASVGCSGPEDIEGRDRSALFQDLRAVWTMRGAGEERAESREGREPAPRSRGLLALELDLVHGKGDTDQDLGLGDRIEIGGTDFFGPANVRADSDFFTGSLAVRGGAQLAPEFAIEGLGGIAWYRLDLRVSGAGTREAETFDSVGPLLGAQFTYEPLRPIALHARGTAGLGLGSDVAEVLAGELGLAVPAARRARIFGGWRWWSYELNAGGGDSDVRLDLSGPTIGVELRF